MNLLYSPRPVLSNRRTGDASTARGLPHHGSIPQPSAPLPICRIIEVLNRSTSSIELRYSLLGKSGAINLSQEYLQRGHKPVKAGAANVELVGSRLDGTMLPQLNSRAPVVLPLRQEARWMVTIRFWQHPARRSSRTPSPGRSLNRVQDRFGP